nr:sodium channel protein Nach-like isoform X2 [Danaus plexippus plexippus]
MKGGFHTLFRRFCLETSILGLKYFYLYPDLFSRCFWGISLISVLYLAFQMTIFLYKRFDEMPTRITIENQFEPMLNISYPAITICSPNQITLTAMKHLNRTLVDGNRTLDLIAILPQLLGFYTITEVNIDSLKNLEDLLLVNRYYATEILSLVPQSCDDFLKLCYLDKIRYPKCKGLFNPILTNGGMCCIFNSMYAYRNHRRNEKIRNFVGYSGRITGILSGLTVVTDYNPDDAVDGTIIHAGALKIMVSESTTFPVEDESNLIHTNAESFHLLNPIYTYCSTEVSSLPSWSRNCYFPDEKWLSHFQHYRRSDCEVLCAAKDIERSCNCWPPYLPYARNICNITSIACIKTLWSLIPATVSETAKRFITELKRASVIWMDSNT